MTGVPVPWACVSQKRQIAFLAALAFCLYAIHRVRFVGSSDGWAYFAQAELFRGQDPGLHSFPDPLRHPALTPLGMGVARGHYVSAFPPGYSALLAVFGLTSAEYWANPFLGAVSVLLVYAALVREVGHWWALALAALWAACPLVGMNATDVMSDMLATVAILGSYLLLRAGRGSVAGAVLGLSLAIRPMNALFLPASALMLGGRKREGIGHLAGFAAGAAASAAANYLVWGALLSPGHGDDLSVFSPRSFLSRLPAYTWQTLLHLGPIFLLALLEGIRSPRRSAPELAWFLAFLLVQPLEGALGVDWLHARYLLPAYPALFVMAARAARDLGPLLRRKIPRPLPLAVMAVVLTASWGVQSLARSFRIGALAVHPPRDVDCDQVASHVPRNALVGAREFSGSLRLYAGLETFGWGHEGAVEFARSEYLRGRPVYLLLEPDEMLAGPDRTLTRRFPAAFVLRPEFSLQAPGYVLQKIVGVRTPGYSHLVLSEPSSDWALLDGWLGRDELWASDYVAAFCQRARLRIPLEVGAEHELRVTAAAPDIGPPVTMQVSISEHSIGRVELDSRLRPATFRVDRVAATGIVILELGFAGAPACDATPRRVVARVQAIDTRPLPR